MQRDHEMRTVNKSAFQWFFPSILQSALCSDTKLLNVNEGEYALIWSLPFSPPLLLVVVRSIYRQSTSFFFLLGGNLWLSISCLIFQVKAETRVKERDWGLIHLLTTVMLCCFDASENQHKYTGTRTECICNMDMGSADIFSFLKPWDNVLQSGVLLVQYETPCHTAMEVRPWNQTSVPHLRWTQCEHC